MKFEYIVVYENSSVKFDIGHCLIKVKVTMGLGHFSACTTIQSGSITQLVQRSGVS